MLKKALIKMKKEQIRKERQKVVKNAAIGVIGGITAGVIGGILLAPKSGKETRNDMANAATEIKKGSKDFVQNHSSKLKFIHLKQKKIMTENDEADTNNEVTAQENESNNDVM